MKNRTQIFLVVLSLVVLSALFAVFFLTTTVRADEGYENCSDYGTRTLSGVYACKRVTDATTERRCWRPEMWLPEICEDVPIPATYACGDGTVTATCTPWNELSPNIREYIGNQPADKCYAAAEGSSEAGCILNWNNTSCVQTEGDFAVDYEFCGSLTPRNCQSPQNTACTNKGATCVDTHPSCPGCDGRTEPGLCPSGDRYELCCCPSGRVWCGSGASLTCCPNGQVCTSGACTSPPLAPPTVSISAEPNPVDPPDDNFTNLNWTIGGGTADSCTASGDWSRSIGHRAGLHVLSGVRVTPPSETYNISCTNAGGTATDSVTVTVIAPPTCFITATPATIASGEPSSINWSCARGTYPLSSGQVIKVSNNTVFWSTVSGTRSSGPLIVDETYTLTCTDNHNFTGTCSVLVDVRSPNESLPPTCAITATPATIASGGSSSINWSCTRGTYALASGQVIKASNNTVFGSTVNGTRDSGPLIANETYNFTCTDNQDNDCVASAPIDVPPVPILCSNEECDAGESCDGGNFCGNTCISQGFDGGTLSCTDDCGLNTSGCCSSVDCIYTWNAWSCDAWDACIGGQQSQTCTRTPNITTPASCGGTACPAAESEDREQECPIPPNCSDGDVDINEECDPPNGTTCDDACQCIYSWANGACGGGACVAGQREQIPTVPSGCPVEAHRCVADPTCVLSATLTATPSSGTEPLNNVSLTATASGEEGTLNYTFYCKDTDVPANFVHKLDATSTNPYTSPIRCSGYADGIYNAKVVVERGESGVTALAPIIVGDACDGMVVGAWQPVPGLAGCCGDGLRRETRTVNPPECADDSRCTRNDVACEDDDLPIVNMFATPTEVAVGGTTEISWWISGGEVDEDSCTPSVSGGASNWSGIDIGDRTNEGTRYSESNISVPADDTIYYLTCKKDGEDVVGQAHVGIRSDCKIVLKKIEPNTASTRIYWSVEGAQECDTIAVPSSGWDWSEWQNLPEDAINEPNDSGTTRRLTGPSSTMVSYALGCNCLPGTTPINGPVPDVLDNPCRYLSSKTICYPLFHPGSPFYREINPGSAQFNIFEFFRNLIPGFVVKTYASWGN